MHLGSDPEVRELSLPVLDHPADEDVERRSGARGVRVIDDRGDGVDHSAAAAHVSGERAGVAADQPDAVRGGLADPARIGAL